MRMRASTRTPPTGYRYRVTTWRDIRLDRAGRTLAALLLAPFTLRLLLLVDPSRTLALQDLRGFACDLAITLLMLPVVFAACRASRWLGAAVVVAWTVLQYSNYETVSQLGSLASALDLHFLGDSTFLLGSAVVLERPVVFGLLVAGSGLLVLLAPRPAPWRSAGVSVVAGLGLFGALSVWPWTDAVAVWRQTNFVQQNLGLLVAPDRARIAGAPEFPDPPSAMFALWPGLHADLEGESILPDGRGGAKNVLVIVLESIGGAFIPSLAADHGYDDLFELPELEALARDHLSYSSFINHNRKTNRGMYSIVCGEPPNLLPGTPKMSVHASGGWQRCLPEIMRDLGFKTVFMQGAPLPFMLKDQFMARAGFDVLHGYEYFETMEAYARSHWGVDDRSFFEKTLDRVTELHDEEQPFFMTLLTVGTHHPFVFPKGYQGKTYGRRRRALRYADLAVGEFVRGLAERGILDDTLVLITSDESAGMQPASSFKPLQVTGLTNSISQNWGVLIVLSPEGLQERVQEPYGQMDLALSVLDYLGRGEEGAHLFGRSVFRRYAEPRLMFFANTNRLRVSGLDTAGHLIRCGAVWGLCRKYALVEGQLFRGGRVRIDYDEEKDGIFFEMAQRSVLADRRIRRTDYQLLADPVVVIDQPSKQVIYGGQYLDLKEGQWMEVEMEVEARSDDNAIINFWHYAKAGAKTWTLDRASGRMERSRLLKGARLHAGEVLKVRYTITPEKLMQGVRCQSSASLVRGRAMELTFKKARLSVRWGEDRPELGMRIEQWEVAPIATD